MEATLVRTSRWVLDTLGREAGQLVDAVWQDGWQRAARRNAWRAMVADHARARARAEADAAVQLALRGERHSALEG